MSHTTFGPHRGADWLGRVALATDSPSAAAERFVLRLLDPKRPRALWVQWTLDCALGSAQVRVDAVLVDELNHKTHKLGEVWPQSRLLVDKERAGLGIGECHLDEGSAWGLLRDNSCAIAFSAAYTRTRPGAPLAPNDRWLTGRRLSQNVALFEPEAHVDSGYIEVYAALGRNAPRERIELQGWTASVTHAWGQAPIAPAISVQLRADATQKAHLSVVSYPTKLWGLIARRASVAYAQAGELALALTGLRELLASPSATCDVANGRYDFAIASKRGRIFGHATAPKEKTSVLAGPGGTLIHVCEGAHLEATLEVYGQAAVPLRSERASFEAIVQAP